MITNREQALHTAVTAVCLQMVLHRFQEIQNEEIARKEFHQNILLEQITVCPN